MEPATTSFLTARDRPPPTKTAHLGEGQAPAQPDWAGSAFRQILSILLVGAFAWALRLAGYDVMFADPSNYPLAVLCFCLWKLELLHQNHGGDVAEAARERRRIGLVAWAVSMGMGSLIALHVADAASSLALRIALWLLAGLAMVLSLYLVFAARRGDSCTDDAESWADKDLRKLSPEQRV